RAARRLAERRDVPWLAVFVEPPRFQHRPEAEREAVARALRLAEQLGAEAAVVPGSRIADALARYALQRNVSELLVGERSHAGWRALAHRSVAARLIACRGPIDVRVLGTETDETTAPGRRALRQAPPARQTWNRYVLAAIFVAVAGLLAAGV